MHLDLTIMAIPTFQLFHTLRHGDAPFRLYLDPEGDYMGAIFERGPLFEVLYLVFSRIYTDYFVVRFTPVYQDNLGCQQRSPPRNCKTMEG